MQVGCIDYTKILDEMIEKIIEFSKSDFKFMPSIVALVAMQTTLGGISPFPSYILASVYLISILIILMKQSCKIEKKWLALWICLPCSILIAQPHPIFQSWPRLFLFSCLFFCMTPTIQSTYAREYRRNVFNMAIFCCILISYASFVAYFLGINLFSAEGLIDEEFYGVAGLFSGITKQSMLLGPISGVASIYLFYNALKKKSIFSWAIIIPAIACVFFSASRSALGATFAGCLILMYYRYSNKGIFIKNLIIMSMIAFFSFPLWQSSTVALQNKQALHTGKNEKFDSRTGKVEARISEFESSPIFGVGFAAFDYHGKDSFNKINGQIEPGTSWLALLSMTGLIGFILFCNAYITTFKRAKIIKETWLIGLFGFFSVHMLVEGYIYAGGSALAFLLWGTLGQCYDTVKLKINK